MAFLAVNESGCEYVFEWVPFRSRFGNYWDTQRNDAVVELPKGSIAKLIGRELTWEDEPVMIE